MLSFFIYTLEKSQYIPSIKPVKKLFTFAFIFWGQYEIRNRPAINITSVTTS